MTTCIQYHMFDATSSVPVMRILGNSALLALLVLGCEGYTHPPITLLRLRNRCHFLRFALHGIFQHCKRSLLSPPTCASCWTVCHRRCLGTWLAHNSSCSGITATCCMLRYAGKYWSGGEDILHRKYSIVSLTHPMISSELRRPTIFSAIQEIL
ncbi:hypothetical protein EDC04DRAFT_450545 [Pisolithus marmoratus]|nr:hypothetical protein EDC04DRAFT_450545 [Pisolithus marmoratus]